MKSPLQLLILEENAFDAESAVTVLEGADYSCAWDRVQTRNELAARLDRPGYDLILADYHLPGLDALSALTLVQSRGIDIPFIVCSSTVGDEAVTEIFKAGATDYLLKTRLDRLPLVVGRALKERDGRRERRQAEEALHQSERRHAAAIRTPPAVVVDVTESHRQEVARAALLEMATTIQGMLDLGEILERVHSRILPLLPCDRVLTYRWDATESTFQLLAAHAVPGARALDPDAVDVIPAELFQTWIDRGRPIVVSSIKDEPGKLDDWSKRFCGTGFLGAPLTCDGRLVGVMIVARTGAEVEFESRTIELFDGIARQVAMAMGAADLYCAKEQEAQHNGALAEVGYQLISGVNRPDLLNRLCQVTTRALNCSRSYTALWKANEQAYVPVASHGYSGEEWEALRALKLTPARLAEVLTRLRRRDAVSVSSSEDVALAAFAAAPPATTSLWMALRRGRDVDGIHIATYDHPVAEVPQHHERLGRALAQLASLAIENARLVEEVNQANRLKGDFVATISHELRTPLNTILGYTDLLLEEAMGPVTAEQTRTLRQVEKSGQRLLGLINTTLDISRLDAGTLPLNLVSTSVSELIGELKEDTLELREQSSVSFIWKVPPGLPRIETDRTKLKVVVTNLIANALKFTPEGSVTVAVGVRQEGIEIAVVDTGIGIAPDILPIVFEAFRQGESPMRRHYGGVGLGLYIVRRLLDILGGTIDVESRVGTGSTFRVWVPRTATSDRKDALAPTVSRVA